MLRARRAAFGRGRAQTPADPGTTRRRGRRPGRAPAGSSARSCSRSAVGEPVALTVADPRPCATTSRSSTTSGSTGGRRAKAAARRCAAHRPARAASTGYHPWRQPTVNRSRKRSSCFGIASREDPETTLEQRSRPPARAAPRWQPRWPRARHRCGLRSQVAELGQTRSAMSERRAAPSSRAVGIQKRRRGASPTPSRRPQTNPRPSGIALPLLWWPRPPRCSPIPVLALKGANSPPGLHRGQPAGARVPHPGAQGTGGEGSHSR